MWSQNICVFLCTCTHASTLNPKSSSYTHTRWMVWRWELGLGVRTFGCGSERFTSTVVITATLHPQPAAPSHVVSNLHNRFEDVLWAFIKSAITACDARMRRLQLGVRVLAQSLSLSLSLALSLSPSLSLSFFLALSMFSGQTLSGCTCRFLACHVVGGVRL